jgi:hypothetical protein
MGRAVGLVHILYISCILLTKYNYKVLISDWLLRNRYLPYVGWVTIIMTEKPLIKVSSESESEMLSTSSKAI